MHSTDRLAREKELISALAAERLKQSAPEECGSYFRKSELSSALKPYAFDTVVVLRAELEELWKDRPDLRPFIPAVLAATFKSRPASAEEEQKTEEGRGSNGLLPVYTYTL